MQSKTLKAKLRKLSQKYAPAKSNYEEKLETFIWEGVFEGKKAEYRRSTGLIQLMLKSGREVLTIQYFRCPGLKRTHFLSRLPDAVYVNNRLTRLVDIIIEPRAKEVEILLQKYFKEGKPLEMNRLPDSLKGNLRVLFSSYQTFNQFIKYLQREYLEFYTLSERYKGRPIKEILNIPPTKKVNRLQILQEELREAIVLENYERATLLKNEIVRLKKRK